MEKKPNKEQKPNVRAEFLDMAAKGTISWEHFVDLIEALDNIDRIMGRADQAKIH